MAINDYVLAAAVLAWIGCAYKMQFNALIYMLAVVYGVAYDFPRFLLVSFLYVALGMFGQFIAANR